jgi:hypothetical protein
LADVFGDEVSLRMAVESGEVILGRPGSFVIGTPVVAAARLLRLAQPGEVVVGERAATATAGAFELQQRDGAYVLAGVLAPTRSPAQLAEPGRGLACDGLVGFRVRVVERQRLGSDPTTGDLAAVGVPAGEPWAAGLPSWGALVPPGSGRRRLRLRHPPYERRAGYPPSAAPASFSKTTGRSR